MIFFMILGQRAVSVLLMEGRQLAETLEGPERHQLLTTCDNVQRLTKELADLKAKGMVSPFYPRLLSLISLS